MHASIRSLALAFLVTTALAPLAHAGGWMVRAEGPEKDGKYFVHTYNCSTPQAMKVTAFAEGTVNGTRRTVPLVLKPTKETGVYTFERNWPSEGLWVLRLSASQGRKPVTLAAIASNGVVGENEFLWESDGRHECDQKLAAVTK